MAAGRAGTVRYRSILIKLGITLALYGFVFLRVDVAQLADRIASARWSYVALAVGVYVCGQLTSAYRWYLLLAPVRLVVSYGRVTAFYFIGMFFNFFLPTIVGGDAVKAVLLTRETGSPARATISVFMERNLGLAALLVIATGAVFQAPPIEVAGVPLKTIVLGLALAFVAANALIFSQRAYELLDRLVALTPLGRVWPGAGQLHASLALYLRSPRTVLPAFALSLFFQIVVIVVVSLCARALGLDVPAAALAVFVPLIALGGMLPVTINGLGVRDALYLLLFGRIGTPPDIAVSLALLHVAVTFIASLAGGVVYLVQDRSAREVGP
jgi:uncharacterized protein (TIRG00374 family)